jgi:phage tail-like protein
VIDAPVSASVRRYLTASLPAVFVEDERPSLAIDPPVEPFVVRWLSGLELTLDPIVTLLDNFAWHLEAKLCPDGLVRELLCLLGLEIAADLDPAVRRSLLRRAIPLGRRRGTLAGLTELLGHAFGGRQIRVTHSGRVTQGANPWERPPAAAPAVEVHCPLALSPEDEDALRRLVDYACPANVAWTLRIGAGGPAA